MKRQLSNIKEWLREVIHDAIKEAFRKYYHHEDPATEFLTAKEAAAFIGDALPTFYRRVSTGEIVTRGGGKRIWVRKSDLLAWLNQDRTYSKAHLEDSIIDQMIERRSK